MHSLLWMMTKVSLHLLRMRLSALRFSVTPCTNGQDALAAARQETFDIAVTDLRLRAEDGLALTEELLRIQPGLPVIILAHGSIPNAVGGDAAGRLWAFDQTV